MIGERWSEKDERIGAFKDPVGTRYRLVAVRVERPCNRALEALRPDKDNIGHFPTQPAGCPPLKSAANAQSVVVVKRKP